MPHRLIEKGVDEMLCLNLNQGEYMTIGESVVVQLDSIVGDRCKLVINAPKEVPVLRGKVLERNGGQRPGCVFEGPRWHRKELVWDLSKVQALAAMRTLLSQMDSQDSNVLALRRQLNHMFPDKTERATEVSNG